MRAQRCASDAAPLSSVDSSATHLLLSKRAWARSDVPTTQHAPHSQTRFLIGAMDSLSLGLSALDGLPWDALAYEDDALGGGSSGGGSGGGSGSGGGATAAHEAARSGKPAAPEAPKCVDSTHARGCRRCVAARRCGARRRQ
jgi:hypothetical protein